MKSLSLVFACLLAFAGSAPARPRPRCGGAAEMAAPRLDAELRGQAQRQAATLTDLLYLSPAQARCLQASVYEQLWQLQPGTPGQVLPGPARAAVLRRYHASLVRVLRPGQYGGLLRLEDDQPEPETEAEAAPLARR